MKPHVAAAALAASLAACITTEHTSPAPATVPEVVVSAPTELWRVIAGGEHVGWVVRYTPADARDAFLSVRNAWQQEIGMIDAEGRWWRFQAHRDEPAQVGAGATADGVAAILGLGGTPELEPAPLEALR